MPHMIVMRPGDANEVVEAWKTIMPFKHNPVALVLTRQALPTIDRSKYAPASGVSKGGYVLADVQGGKPEVILIGTGSEVALCIDAATVLDNEGIPTRVVSMPSWDRFSRQSEDYRREVTEKQIQLMYERDIWLRPDRGGPIT